MSSSLGNNVALALLTFAATACVRTVTTPCPAKTAPAPVQVAPSGPGWLDPDSLKREEPLALHEIQWVLKSADETPEVIVPSSLYTFTLGRWECALSEERSADSLEAARLTVARERRLVCTHASGLTVQSELACGYEAPSRAEQGAPVSAGRQAELSLAEAPALTWSCRPNRVERVQVRGRASSGQEVCVSDGRSVAPCSEGS